MARARDQHVVRAESSMVLTSSELRRLTPRRYVLSNLGRDRPGRAFCFVKSLSRRDVAACGLVTGSIDEEVISTAPSGEIEVPANGDDRNERRRKPRSSSVNSFCCPILVIGVSLSNITLIEGK